MRQEILDQCILFLLNKLDNSNLHAVEVLSHQRSEFNKLGLETSFKDVDGFFEEQHQISDLRISNLLNQCPLCAFAVSLGFVERVNERFFDDLTQVSYRLIRQKLNEKGIIGHILINVYYLIAITTQ